MLTKNRTFRSFKLVIHHLSYVALTLVKGIDVEVDNFTVLSAGTELTEE